MLIIKTPKPLHILIDADMLLYKMAAVFEREVIVDDEYSFLYAPHDEIMGAISDKTQEIIEKVCKHLDYEGAFKLLMVFSSDTNFRKSFYPSYKANRVGKRKPLGYKWCREKIKDTYETKIVDSLEADDTIGIIATSPSLKGSCVIVSGDKDFKTIPGKFYDYLKDELYDISEEDANFYFMYQTLIGDATDGYKGCPGVGAVTGTKLLNDTTGNLWDAVVEQYSKKGLDKNEALTQARLARILHYNDYDFKTKSPILWTPKS